MGAPFYGRGTMTNSFEQSMPDVSKGGTVPLFNPPLGGAADPVRSRFFGGPINYASLTDPTGQAALDGLHAAIAKYYGGD